MKIVRISKDPTRLVFGDENIPDRIALKVNYKGSKSAPFFMNLKNQEDFKKAISPKGKGNRTINGFFSSGDYKENQIFIVLDDWREQGAIDKGYEMARELLNTVGKNKVFNLYFVSLFTTECLSRMVKDDNRVMVRTFPHLCFADLEVFLTPDAYSILHFKLIRDVAISNRGRLSAIRHEVKNNINIKNATDEQLKGLCETQKSHALKVLNDLDFKPYCDCYPNCKERIEALRIMANGLLDEQTAEGLDNAWLKLEMEIFELIDMVESRLPSDKPNEDESSKKPKVKEGYRVLIVEDDLNQRKELYGYFSERYQYVACNDMQEVLGDELERDDSAIWDLTLTNPESALEWFGHEKNLQDFDIIILDLLFKYRNSDVWLPFNGLDLLRLARINSPFSTVRIITSLPRNEISTILGEEKKLELPINHVFTKSNGWDQLKICLGDRRDEMERDSKSNAKLRDFAKNMVGPSLGFFDSAAVRRLIAELRNTEVCGQWAFDICFLNALQMLDPSVIASNPRESIPLPKHESGTLYDEDALTRILAHRIAFLRWSAKKFPAQLRKINIRDYHVELEDLCLKKKDNNGNIETPGKSYFNTALGFSCSGSKENLTVSLDLKEMLPEEVELYKRISKENGLSAPVSEKVNEWLVWVVCDACEEKNDIQVFQDFLAKPESNINYGTIKKFIDNCCAIVNSGSTGRGVAALNRDIVGFLESIFSKETFEKYYIEGYYDDVIAELKEHGIYKSIIGEACVEDC